ncbi:DUF2459 domain-containing protein [Calditrichota bacterium GD2]
MVKKILLTALAAFLLFVILVSLTIAIDSRRLQKRNVFPGEKAIHIFNYGWHTGLVVEVQDIPEDYLPYFAMLKEHRFIEISWGDERFYQARGPGINWLLAIRALLWPTNSVLHLVGFKVPVDHFYRWSKYYTIYLTDEEFENLIYYVCSFFETDQNHKFIIIDRGLYGDSWFMKSKGTYIFPNTCNVWTARALKAAHLPLTPVIYQYPSFLVRVLENFSRKQKNHKNIRLAIIEQRE